MDNSSRAPLRTALAGGLAAPIPADAREKLDGRMRHAQKAGGTISVESAVNAGTTFTISLPTATQLPVAA